MTAEVEASDAAASLPLGVSGWAASSVNFLSDPGVRRESRRESHLLHHEWSTLAVAAQASVVLEVGPEFGLVAIETHLRQASYKRVNASATSVSHQT